jgi:hypothetical protein
LIIINRDLNMVIKFNDIKFLKSLTLLTKRAKNKEYFMHTSLHYLEIMSLC